MDKSFVMLVGLPASGKSTRAAQHLENNPNAVIISADAEIEQAAADEGITYQEAFVKYTEDANRVCTAKAREAFAAGKTVIWDQNNLDPDTRAKRLAMVPVDYFKLAIAFEVDKDELVNRIIDRYKKTGKIIPGDVLNQMEASYDRPGRYEGFDHIEIVEDY